MTHWIVESKIMDRRLVGREHQEVRSAKVFTATKDKTTATVHLHTGTNVVDADAWAIVKESDAVKKLLADGKLVDKGKADPITTESPPILDPKEAAALAAKQAAVPAPASSSTGTPAAKA